MPEGRRRAWGLVAALALTLGSEPSARASGALAQEGPGLRPIPTVTRLVTIFSGLENDWLEAVRKRDTAAVEALLGEDFEMRTASRPGEPIPRDEWIRRALSARAVSWTVHEMAARDLGGTVVVSFRLEPAPPAGSAAGRGAFVVDTWVRERGGWRVAARYLAGSDGLPLGLAGDAPPSGILPKKY